MGDREVQAAPARLAIQGVLEVRERRVVLAILELTEPLAIQALREHREFQATLVGQDPLAIRDLQALQVDPQDRQVIQAAPAVLEPMAAPEAQADQDPQASRDRPDRPDPQASRDHLDLNPDFLAQYMKYWWQSFNGALTKDECDFLVEFGLSLPPVAATVGHGGKSVVDDHLRRSKVRWLSRCDLTLEGLYAKIETMALKANANAFGFDLAGFHEVQFTEYNATDSGTYGWHEDNNWTKDTPFDRKMSMVIQLSDKDDYTGGRLELTHDPLPAGTFENRGDAIFFPAFNRHRVTPVKLGVRYSLVTWFVGPKFR